MDIQICSVFIGDPSEISSPIVNITYDRRSYILNCVLLYLNNVNIATFYNVKLFDFLEDRTYIFV